MLLSITKKKRARAGAEALWERSDIYHTHKSSRPPSPGTYTAAEGWRSAIVQMTLKRTDSKVDKIKGGKKLESENREQIQLSELHLWASEVYIYIRMSMLYSKENFAWQHRSKSLARHIALSIGMGWTAWTTSRLILPSTSLESRYLRCK